MCFEGVGEQRPGIRGRKTKHYLLKTRYDEEAWERVKWLGSLTPDLRPPVPPFSPCLSTLLPRSG
jgi:hypothetical protein